MAVGLGGRCQPTGLLQGRSVASRDWRWSSWLPRRTEPWPQMARPRAGRTWAQAALGAGAWRPQAGWPPAPCPQHVRRLPPERSSASSCRSNERGLDRARAPLRHGVLPARPRRPGRWPPRTGAPRATPRVPTAPARALRSARPRPALRCPGGCWETAGAPITACPPAGGPGVWRPTSQPRGGDGTVTENPDPLSSPPSCAGDVLFQMAEVHRQIQNQLEETVSLSRAGPGSAAACRRPGGPTPAPVPLAQSLLAPRGLPVPVGSSALGSGGSSFPWGHLRLSQERDPPPPRPMCAPACGLS